MSLTDRLAPLREETPTDADIAAVVQLARRPRPRRRRRLAGALAVATAAAAVVIAALPASRPSDPAALLRAAAAAADDEPPAFTGYRYTEVVEHWRWELRDGVEEVEQRVENWVDREWHGRRLAHDGKVIHGRDQNFFAEPHDDAFVYGDGPLADIDIAALPTEPHALLRMLDANERGQNWAPGLPTEAQARFDIVYSVLLLLGTANTTPELRSALWGVLALMPDLTAKPGTRDPLGRDGDAVTLPAGPRGSFEVIFDPDSSELLSWSLTGVGGGTPAQTHTFVRGAHVRNIGDRPE